MAELERCLKAVERATRRKKELKSLIEVLFDEYRLIKKELEMHKAQIEKLMSAKEYSAFLDTMELDSSLEFPVFSDKRTPEKK